MKLSLRPVTRALTYGKQLRPSRDWLVLLACFFTLVLVSVAWNLLQFSRTLNGQPVGSAPFPPAAEVELDSVRSLFERRAGERARYESEYRFVDPSL